MLSTYADDPVYSRFQFILCLSILLCGHGATCQNVPETIQVAATDTSQIRYSPVLTNTSGWGVDQFGDEKEVFTQHHSATLSFQYKGVFCLQAKYRWDANAGRRCHLGRQISLLADPDNFDADLVVVTFDSKPYNISQNRLDRTKGGDGLFTFFNITPPETAFHTVMVQKSSKGNNGSWNLVMIEWVTPCISA